MKRLNEIAGEQDGLFTAAQAREAGVGPMALVMQERRGGLVREAHGVYRDPRIPETRWTPYRCATLWPRGVTGVLSHETALALFELSDVDPGVIHLTLPARHRVRRAIPAAYHLHFADLAGHEITRAEGLPVTTVARALRDCGAAHLDRRLLRQAFEEAARTGRLTAADAKELAQELFERPALKLTV